jgi:ABC-type Fe3+/spermidine/putrescine transport system ATPase subunit
MMQAASVDLRRVTYTYGHTRALTEIDLTVNPGELVTMVGPSGCGKSTLLRIVAGLLRPTEGEVLLDGTNVGGVSPEKRNIGWMPQSYALFEHLDVAQNIAFGLRMRGADRAAQRQRVGEMLELCQIVELADRPVTALSGGQRQRVAIARALAVHPRVLLLDEPLAALDPQLRIELRAGLEKLLHDSGVTTLFVTHDQSEALAMADRVAVLKDGYLQQYATPEDVWNLPANAFVASFFGHSVVLPTRRTDPRTLEILAGIHVNHAGHDEPAVVLRAADLVPCPPGHGHPVEITAVEYMGQGYKTTGRSPAGVDLRFLTERRHDIGERLHVTLKDGHIPAQVNRGG